MFVETKTDGEARPASGPTLCGFLAWLEGKPAEETYEWRDPRICPGAQYARAIGMERSWRHRVAHADEHWRIWRQIGMLAFLAPGPRPRTFGALRKRVRAAVEDAE